MLLFLTSTTVSVWTTIALACKVAGSTVALGSTIYHVVKKED